MNAAAASPNRVRHRHATPSHSSLNLKKTLTHTVGVATMVGALLLSGWAASQHGAAAQAQPSTLAPIMATRSSGDGPPQHAIAAMRPTSRPRVRVAQSQR